MELVSPNPARHNTIDNHECLSQLFETKGVVNSPQMRNGLKMTWDNTTELVIFDIPEDMCEKKRFELDEIKEAQ